ncbi:MAG TPA: hypothetical protein VMT88_09750, partial [Actinomycetes bacterium]|nr:hypothetical protein [Actinomycetes bacterium]
FSQIIPGFLNEPPRTSLALAESVCRHERARPSMKIAPVRFPVHGRHSLSVDGVRLSFVMPSRGWGMYGNVNISKSIVGPQDAEGII